MRNVLWSAKKVPLLLWIDTHTRARARTEREREREREINYEMIKSSVYPLAQEQFHKGYLNYSIYISALAQEPYCSLPCLKRGSPNIDQAVTMSFTKVCVRACVRACVCVSLCVRLCMWVHKGD